MFEESEYRSTMQTLCGDMKECKFPDGYWGNIRIWDYKQIVDNGEFRDTDEVLECGSLHSYFCVYLSQKVKKYTVGDSFYWAKRDYCKNPAFYQTPEEWCEYVAAKGRGHIVAEEADIQKLPYADAAFDKVISISTIEHVHEDRKGMLELMRVLKPGGLLLITTEYNPTWSRPYSEHDGSFYRVYDKAGLDVLLEGFNVEETVQHVAVQPGQFTTLFVKIRKPI